MTWTWFFPWRRHRVADTSDEARAALEKLEKRDAEIIHLGHELRAAQRRNHFSRLVNEAIGRARET